LRLKQELVLFSNLNSAEEVYGQRGPRGPIPEEFDFEEFLRPSFGVFQGEPVKVRIWFAPDAAGYIKEKIWHDTQQLVPQKDGSVIFEAEVARTDEIRFWVMSWGSKAEVLEPESLREEIRAESEALLEKYGRGLLRDEKPSLA
jgi:predicted DNA-binding transcriptional regulator YafY